MTHIVKKAITPHQKKLSKKYGIRFGSYFYRVKNKAGETLKDFATKKEALNYSKKKRGV